MENDVELIKRLYDDFNARNIDSVLAMLTEDVMWANAMDGGYARGHEGIREYWTHQWSMVSPHVEPVVTVLTPLLTARAVAVEDGSAHARWLGRRWVGGWFFGGCSRRRLSRREGTAAQATALVGSCGAGRFARAAAMRRPA